MTLGADKAMNARTIAGMMTTIFVVALGLGLGGCFKIEGNRIPVAKVVVRQGDKTIGAMDMIKLDGGSVKITLDGKGSSDPDGEVVEYEWIRTDVPAAARRADSGVAPDDDSGVKSTVPRYTGNPEPKATTDVTLTQVGKYRYSLWVTDNDGEVSAPASVTVTVVAP